MRKLLPAFILVTLILSGCRQNIETAKVGEFVHTIHVKDAITGKCVELWFHNAGDTTDATVAAPSLCNQESR